MWLNVSGLRVRVQDVEHGVIGKGFGVQGLGSIEQSLEFRV